MVRKSVANRSRRRSRSTSRCRRAPVDPGRDAPAITGPGRCPGTSGTSGSTWRRRTAAAAGTCQMTAYRIRRVLDTAPVPSDLGPVTLSRGDGGPGVDPDIGGLKSNTINHYIRAIKAFCRWLWKDGKAREHRLAHLATSNPEVDRRYIRRALTPDEAARIISRGIRPVVMDMTGIDRAMLYTVASPRACDRGANSGRSAPRVRPRCRPPDGRSHLRRSKNKQATLQPLPAAVAERLRPWLATKTPGLPVSQG